MIENLINKIIGNLFNISFSKEENFNCPIFVDFLFSILGINIPDLEAQYLRIFFDDTLDNIARMRLSVKLSAVQVHLHIDKAIEPLDEFDAELDNSDKKGKKGQEKWQIRKEFEEFCGKLKTKQMIKLVDVCEMWNFGIYVDSAIDALQMAKNSGRLKKLRKNKIHRKKE